VIVFSGAAAVAVGAPCCRLSRRSSAGSPSSSSGRQRAEAALTRLGLADKRSQWPFVLSGEQKEAAGVAAGGRAAGRGPRGCLAFDEPLRARSCVDADFRCSGFWSGSGRNRRCTAILGRINVPPRQWRLRRSYPVTRMAYRA